MLVEILEIGPPIRLLVRVIFKNNYLSPPKYSNSFQEIPLVLIPTSSPTSIMLQNAFYIQKWSLCFC